MAVKHLARYPLGVSPTPFMGAVADLMAKG